MGNEQPAGEGKPSEVTESKQETVSTDVKASTSATEEKEKTLESSAGSAAGPAEKEGEAMNTTA